MLNDEVLSASTSPASPRAFAPVESARETPRYSEAAGVEHHPQITDFVPRRLRTIALLVFCGAVTATGLALLNYYALAIAEVFGLPHAAALDLSAPGSLAGWVEAIVLLLSSATCMLVYSIRRHRIDDYRGRYRAWLAAAAACLILSADSVAGLYSILGQGLVHFTGWLPFRQGTIWWLIVGGVPLVWIFIRVLLDAFECRLAASLLVVATMCYVGSAAYYFGLFTSPDPRIESTAVGTSIFIGHWVLLAAIIAYARFVILDAQGLIHVAPRIVGQRRTRSARRARVNDKDGDSPTGTSTIDAETGLPSHSSDRSSRSVRPHSGSDEWVDGRRPERDAYSDDPDDDSPDGNRKLSKSDRKRLRKLKTQNRAA